MNLKSVKAKLRYMKDGDAVRTYVKNLEIANNALSLNYDRIFKRNVKLIGERDLLLEDNAYYLHVIADVETAIDGHVHKD